MMDTLSLIAFNAGAAAVVPLLKATIGAADKIASPAPDAGAACKVLKHSGIFCFTIKNGWGPKQDPSEPKTPRETRGVLFGRNTLKDLQLNCGKRGLVLCRIRVQGLNRLRQLQRKTGSSPQTTAPT